MTAVDDAVLNPLVLADGHRVEVAPVLAVQMFPPAEVAAQVLVRMSRMVGLETVRTPVFDWRPGRRKAAAAASVSPNGRWVVTAAREVIFDDSTAALPPDELDQVWLDTARETGRALLFIGGPGRLESLDDLERAAADGALIGGWCSVSVPARPAL